MDILFVAPVPPPVNGQSKASQVLLEALSKEHNVEVINLSKESLKNGSGSVLRFLKIISILVQIQRKKKGKDLVFLSLAESFAGNMRDIFIYLLCSSMLHRSYVHMLGGAGMMKILSTDSWQKRLNVKFLNKLAGIIVEGPVNFEMFRKVVSAEKIHIIPNFAEDYLFASDEEIDQKFSKTAPLHVLYLSNLISGKGYKELAEAFLSLEDSIKNHIQLSFVGGFEDEDSRLEFMKLTEGESNVRYLGRFIDGEAKRKLYLDSHVFCLPTYYPFEGQPISILEAYATGCVVISSDHSGIPFIFKDRVNGYMVQKKSVESLKEALRKVVEESKGLKQLALRNRNEAFKKYRTEIYQKNMLALFKN